MKCDLCGKSDMYGYNISHSKRHTKRRWIPNVHPATIMIDGKLKQVKVCTRCLRTQNKAAA